MRILISLHLQITKSVPGRGRGCWGGILKTNRQRHIFKVKRRREKIENERFKRGKRGKERAQTEIESYSEGVR